MTLMLVWRQDDELTQAQTNLVWIAPEGIHRDVADEVVSIFAGRPRSPLEQGHELPRVFVFLNISLKKGTKGRLTWT